MNRKIAIQRYKKSKKKSRFPLSMLKRLFLSMPDRIFCRCRGGNIFSEGGEKSENSSANG